MGLGLYKKYRTFISYLNLLVFTIKKYFIGFDVANLFLQRVDRRSVLLILKSNGAKIGSNCVIETGIIFHNCKNYSNLEIGNNVHIGKNCFIDLRGKIILQDNVVISMKCTLITHIDLFKSVLSNKFSPSNDEIRINKDSYLGVNTTVLKGVIIHENSFVAANSLVKNDVVKNSLVAGIPSKFIKEL